MKNSLLTKLLVTSLTAVMLLSATAQATTTEDVLDESTLTIEIALIDDHIGYIYCPTFDEDTALRFKEALETYGSEADRWVVNVSSSSGGDIEEATIGASYFTGSGISITLCNAEGEIVASFTPEEGAMTLSPMVAVTSGDSASASEVYAAIVRDTSAGLVVGERTYGQGFQTILSDALSSDSLENDALSITYVYSPSGNSNNVIGIIPHILVDSSVAEDVALLLSESNPAWDNSNLLRIDFGWRWYVDLDKATSEDYLPAFTALLEALPNTVNLWQGVGDVDEWEATSVETLATTYGLSVSDRSFTDTATSPYATQIDILATYDLLEGTGEGTFSPTQLVTRGDLCTMLTYVFDHWMDVDGANPFVDVPSDSDYSYAVSYLYNLGLVNGITEDSFCPDDLVTHEQLITVFGRMAEMLNLNLYNAQNTREEDALSDEVLSQFSSWAQSEVWLLGQSQSVSLIGNDLSAIDPTAAVTREKAAALLYNLLHYTGILPI